MEWNLIFETIDPSLMVVVAACWAIGYALKLTPRVPDWSIIYILSLLSVGSVIGILGFSIQSVLQGIVCAAVAVYGNQMVKQMRRRNCDDDTTK